MDAAVVEITDLLHASFSFPSADDPWRPMERNWTINPDTTQLNATDSLVGVSLIIEQYTPDSNDVLLACSSLKGTTEVNSTSCIDGSTYADRITAFDADHMPAHVYFKSSRNNRESGFTLSYYSHIESHSTHCNRQTVLNPDATLINFPINSTGAVEGDPIYCNYVFFTAKYIDMLITLVPDSTVYTGIIVIDGNSTNADDFSFTGPAAKFQDITTFRSNNSLVYDFGIHIDEFTSEEHAYSGTLFFVNLILPGIGDFVIPPRSFTFLDCTTFANIDAQCGVSLNHPAELKAGEGIVFSDPDAAISLQRNDLATLYNPVRRVGPYVAAHYISGDSSGVVILPIVSNGTDSWTLGDWDDGLTIIDPTKNGSGELIGVSKPRSGVDLESYRPPLMAVSYGYNPTAYTLQWDSYGKLASVSAVTSLSRFTVSFDIVDTFVAQSTCSFYPNGIVYEGHISQVVGFSNMAELAGLTIEADLASGDTSTVFNSTCASNPISMMISSQTSSESRMDVLFGVPSRNVVKHVQFTLISGGGSAKHLPPGYDALEVVSSTVINGPDLFGEDASLRVADDGTLEAVILGRGRLFFFNLSSMPDAAAVDASDFVSYVRPNHIQTEQGASVTSDTYIPTYETLSSFDDSQFEVSDSMLVLIPTSDSPLGYPQYFSYPRPSTCDLSFAVSSSYFGSCEPCSFGQIRQYSSSDSADSVCVDCLDSEYCPPLSLMHLDYAELASMSTSTQVNMTASDAQDFTDWVLDNTVSFSEDLTRFLVLLILLYAIFVFFVLSLKTVAQLIPRNDGRSKLSPLAWPKILYKDAILPVSRKIDFYPRQFVSFGARRSGKDGVYVNTRGTFVGGLCTPFIWIIWIYVAWYATKFYFSYSEVPLRSSDGVKQDANSIVKSSTFAYAEANLVERALFGASIVEGVSLYVTLIGYDHLDCSGQCLESFGSSNCYAAGIVCSESVYTCTRSPDAFGKSGNCTVKFDFKNVNIEASASITLHFGDVYTQAIHSAVEHAIYDSSFLSDGNNMDQAMKIVGGSYCTDEETASHCTIVNSTDIVYIDRRSDADTVIAGLVARSLRVSPTITKVQEEETLWSLLASPFSNQDRFMWSYVDVYEFGQIIGFEKTTTNEYMYGAAEPLTVTIELTTNAPTFLSRTRVASVSSTFLTLVLTLITLNKIVAAVNSFRIGLMYTVAPLLAKVWRKSFGALRGEKGLLDVEVEANPLYPQLGEE
ncbi:hypothetical protein J8273_8584 [Carpediemonas membranifera]|uniref:Uncharacterized protein n=1 Tax=Carpediemonas membranifera TaxID=201153 RepID=A0A8J6AZT1_9EUKA|nr:hypothetical protein J8273_8584 [Carpediemonas membranifera]|eukprot:KAG9389897.1 hypothetical protein J8273_8584 [Carpediemonas membranifera]